MQPENPSNIAGIILLLLFVIPVIVAVMYGIKAKRVNKKLALAIIDIGQLEDKNNQLVKKLAPITDVEKEAARLQIEANELRKTAQNALNEATINAENLIVNGRSEADELRKVAKSALNEAKLKSEDIIANGRSEAEQAISYANKQAEEIAGAALKAKKNADRYESAIKAMKNTIEGYKDDYIIPNHSVLDDLADEFSHKEAGEKLKQLRKRVKEMVKENRAADCDYAEANRRAYAIHFAVDAFNGKVDSALAKVKQDNFGKIKQEIIDAYALVNHNGAPFRNARVLQEYLDTRLDELKWAVATHELRQQELAEQKAIRDQIREEEKARREMEKAIKEAEKEERLLQKALDKARKELASASEEQKQQYEALLAELEGKLHEAEEKGQRAISMAQQTKRGHVYVISNIGSFGEEVFKVGMTRRLEPMDRVKELGDASVPFSFDVHAMMYSDDAPALEKSLHRIFNDKSVNKVNPRKEFFRLPLSEIRKAVEIEGVEDIHWTLKAEAAEYRESVAIGNTKKISAQEVDMAIA
jgi:hypothetical protein